MTQYGFFIDLSRCIGCHACEIACKQWHNISPGPVKWLRVYQWEKGSFPNIALQVLPVMCFHCENPKCLQACPNQAIYKEDKYGAVLVHTNRCTGERKCWKACPYGAPQFENDIVGSQMSKCDMCLDRLKLGNQPICVLSCSLRALEFGPLDELRQKYGNLSSIEDMPRSSITKPAVVFKPLGPKRQIVPWDSKKAMQLWQKRHSDSGEVLTDVFSDTSDITEDPENKIGRNKLILKAQSAEELMLRTMDDE